MGKIILKIIGVLLAIAVVVIAGFFFIIIASLSGEGDFYAPFILMAGLLSIVWIVTFAFGSLQRKMLWYGLCRMVLASIIAVFISIETQSCIAIIPAINEQGVDLRIYEPFKEESKIARLDEKSSLSISDSLPRINGATAMYPMYASFVQAVYQAGDYPYYNSIVQSGTTPVAYDALMEGDADVIFCASPSAEQVEEARLRNLEFHLTPIGSEAFVFFVNKENPVDELSVEQIQGIYSGKITNWKEVGGNDEGIRAYQRPKNSGSQTMLEKIMGEVPLMMPPQNNIAGGMGHIIDRTADYKNFGNAIGYSFLLFATEMVRNNDIKLLKVNGVYPEKNTIKNKTYPFTGEFYAVTISRDNKNVERLIEWILSPQGQSLIEKTGYVSLN